MAAHPLTLNLLLLVGLASTSTMAQQSETAATAASYQLSASIEEGETKWLFADIELINEQWSNETLAITEVQEKPAKRQCHYKAKLTQEDTQLLLEAVIKCESTNQHSTYELPVFILNRSGGEASMEFGEQQGILWNYHIKLVAKLN
ncbi:hypothetical protein [Shewanella sp.]|uniref:hypothetical protein n=1 Tax=Shewanella sp. TaxID=50422 RepID=UPI004053B6BC